MLCVSFGRFNRCIHMRALCLLIPLQHCCMRSHSFGCFFILLRSIGLFFLVHKSKYVCSRISFALTTHHNTCYNVCVRYFFSFFFLQFERVIFFPCCYFALWWQYFSTILMLMYRKWWWRVEDVNLWMRLTRNLCFFTNFLWLTADVFRRTNFPFNSWTREKKVFDFFSWWLNTAFSPEDHKQFGNNFRQYLAWVFN